MKIKNQEFASVSQLADMSLPATFLNCTFTGLDLSKLDFSGCVFDQCDLSKTKLRKLSRVKFFSCNLNHADLRECDLRWVKAVNCKADKLDLLGAQVTLECGFLDGLKTSRASDHWRLLNWVGALESPARVKIQEMIPEEVRLLLSMEFERQV